MVVIKDTSDSINAKFPRRDIELWTPFSRVIGYSVEQGAEIKIELNPDRPDLFSFETLNDAARVFYGHNPQKDQTIGKSSVEVFVDPSVKGIRKYFFAFIARGPPIENHLRGLIDYQERIHDSIGKDRKKVSIGIHDLEKVEVPVFYKTARKAELKFTTYDGMTGTAEQIISEHQKGKQYAHLTEGPLVPVIVDSTDSVLSMPPIINGDKCAISEQTSSFFVDLEGTEFRALRSAFFLLSHFFTVCGYDVKLARIHGPSDPEIAGIMRHDLRGIVLTQSQSRELLGQKILPAEARSLLSRMGIESRISGDALICAVPGYRDDLMGAADVAEDLAKAYGYGNLQELPLPLPLVGKERIDNVDSSRIREVLIGAGFQEIMTYVVASREIYAPFSEGVNYQIMNPKSQEFSVIRDNLYPNLLHFLSENRSRSTPQKIFEVGHVVSGMEEKIKFCFMILDSKSDFASIKQTLDSVLQRLLGERVRVEHADLKPYISGRGGIVKSGNLDLGIVGEVHPQYLEQFSLKLPVAFAELDLSAVAGK